MKSLFTNKAYEEIKLRLARLNNNSKALWGKMSAAQMVYHCQMPLNIILEEENYNLKPNWIINMLFKKSMYNDKIWKKNLPTVSAFKVTEEKDFASEKLKLESLIDELHDNRQRDNWPRHPSFGKFTKEQWGKMQYKHLDHHLRQFGV